MPADTQISVLGGAFVSLWAVLLQEQRLLSWIPQNSLHCHWPDYSNSSLLKCTTAVLILAQMGLSRCMQSRKCICKTRRTIYICWHVTSSVCTPAIQTLHAQLCGRADSGDLDSSLRLAHLQPVPFLQWDWAGLHFAVCQLSQLIFHRGWVWLSSIQWILWCSLPPYTEYSWLHCDQMQCFERG